MATQKEKEGQWRVYAWQIGIGSRFSDALCDLISLADSNNLELLSKAYPATVKAYTEWYKEGKRAFIKWGYKGGGI